MDERSALGFLAGYQDYSEKKDSEKLYDVVRTLNTQIARTVFMTAPRMWDGASIGALIMLESGLYKSKEMQEKKLEYIYPVAKQFIPWLEEPEYATLKKIKPPAKKIRPILKSLKQLQAATSA